METWFTILMTFSCCIYIFIFWFRYRNFNNVSHYNQNNVATIEATLIDNRLSMNLEIEQKKYLIYDHTNFSKLAKDVNWILVKNALTNEPFYGSFITFLKIIDQNQLLFKNPDSRMITIKSRDFHNQISTSKSYLVHRSIELLHFCTELFLSSTENSSIEELEESLLAFASFILDRSIDYLSCQYISEISRNIIDEVYLSRVSIILNKIKDKNIEVILLLNILDLGYMALNSFSFNDTQITIGQVFNIPQKPNKIIISLPDNV